MIINKEEVEKFIENLLTGDFEDIHIDYGARKGVEFAEEYVYKYTSDLVIENQGLKLYKDNEAERFKELAVEFARHIRGNPKKVEDWNLTIFEEGKFVSDDVRHYDNIEELFETFIKERNEKN
jgi:hypothetical protein